MTASFSFRACTNSGSSSSSELYARSSSCVRFKCRREFCRRPISNNREGRGREKGGCDVVRSRTGQFKARGPPSVIVAGSNVRASENEKGCGCLGWYSMMYYYSLSPRYLCERSSYRKERFVTSHHVRRAYRMRNS